MSRNMWVTGKYTVINKEKYVGDVNNLTFRSSWERIVCQFFDDNQEILRWQMEEQRIPYRSPIDNLMHDYVLDFAIWGNTPDGIKKIMIEVKPKDQVKKPSRKSSETVYSYDERVKLWLVNSAKWEAAVKQAEREGAIFKILTEDQIMPSQNSIKPYRHPKKAVKK